MTLSLQTTTFIVEGMYCAEEEGLIRRSGEGAEHSIKWELNQSWNRSGD